MSGICCECKFCYNNDTMGDLYICVNGNSANFGEYTGLCCDEPCDDCVKWGEEE